MGDKIKILRLIIKNYVLYQFQKGASQENCPSQFFRKQWKIAKSDIIEIPEIKDNDENFSLMINDDFGFKYLQ